MANVRKIKKATQEELSKLHEEYKAFSKSVGGMSPLGLFSIAVAGIVVILAFQSNLFDLIGLAMVFGPLYIFVHRGAHKKGYFEGYYEMMTKIGSRTESTNSEK